MRKSKNKKKKLLTGAQRALFNPKTSPLKTYKKQVKRMNNRLKEPLVGDSDEEKAIRSKWLARLHSAQDHLKNYDKDQEQKKADAMKQSATAKKAG